MNNRLQIIAILAIAATLPGQAIANDENTYRITLLNQTGEALTVVCSGSNPRVVQDGDRSDFTLTGADRMQVQCAGFDHHGDVIASQAVTLDHHHRDHNMTMRRGDHHERPRREGGR